jgi:hypothetical protein
VKAFVDDGFKLRPTTQTLVDEYLPGELRIASVRDVGPPGCHATQSREAEEPLCSGQREVVIAWHGPLL